MSEWILWGYARVSTEDQDLLLQIEALKKYGVEESHIITEKKSGKRLTNRKLYAMLKYMRPKDRLVVWKLDRLGRSVTDLIYVIDRIEEIGADLVSITDGIDTSTAMGRFFFHIMAAIAELERNMTAERTKAGIAARKAKDPDVKWGAKHWFDDSPARQEHIQNLYEEGAFSLVPKPTNKSPDALKLIGMTPAGLMAEANAASRKPSKMENAESIRRWLRQGAPGLQR